MKTQPPLFPVIGALGLITFVFAGCSAKEKAAEAKAVPTPRPVGPRRAAPPPSSPSSSPPSSVPMAAVTSVSDQAAASWSSIKDFTFDQRAEFVAGAGNLLGMLAGPWFPS